MALLQSPHSFPKEGISVIVWIPSAGPPPSPHHGDAQCTPCQGSCDINRKKMAVLGVSSKVLAHPVGFQSCVLPSHWGCQHPECILAPAFRCSNAYSLQYSVSTHQKPTLHEFHFPDKNALTLLSPCLNYQETFQFRLPQKNGSKKPNVRIKELPAIGESILVHWD